MPRQQVQEKTIEDILYDEYNRELYRISGTETTDTILDMLNSNNAATTAESATLPADVLTSGTPTSMVARNLGMILNSLKVGPTQTSSKLSPLDVDFHGNINRVASIRLASASNLGFLQTDIQPAATDKAIWANGNNMTYNSTAANLGLHQFQNVGLNTLAMHSSGEAHIVGSAGRVQPLTNVATRAIFDIALPAGGVAGGEIRWTVFASDGTDHQTLTGFTLYSATNKGGVYTVNTNEVASTGAILVGTLTNVWSIASGTNLVTLRILPTSSLVTTVLTLYYSLTNFGTTGSVTQYFTS